MSKNLDDIDKKWKIIGAGAVIGAITWDKTKDLLLGNPRSKIRKMIVTGILSYTFLTNCQPQLINDAKSLYSITSNAFEKKVELVHSNRNSNDYVQRLNSEINSTRNTLEAVVTHYETLNRESKNNTNSNRTPRSRSISELNLTPNNTQFNYWYSPGPFDTFSQISNAVYGTPDVAPLLKRYNNITTEFPIQGMPIKIIPGIKDTKMLNLRNSFPQNYIIIDQGSIINEELKGNAYSQRDLQRYNTIRGNNIRELDKPLTRKQVIHFE